MPDMGIAPWPILLYRLDMEERTMLTQTDSRRRITLPPATGIKPGDTVEIEVLEDGRILLIPVETIPRHQLWAWTAESKQAITQSLADPRPSESVESSEAASVVAKRWADED
jgi:bifunctional DNA-binding transcriptional regulator/antitoxin component of YhaV-PrlF toxin-antitoxin module